MEAIALGAALGADSLSISIGIGMAGVSLRRALRLATLFGAMQGALLFAGANISAFLHVFLESSAQDVVHSTLALLGAGILCLVGLNLIRGYVSEDDVPRLIYYSGRAALLLLAFSVSIDALSAGVGLGMLDGLDIIGTAGVVTAVIFAMAYVGLRAGRVIGSKVGRCAEPIGGCVLVLLGIHLAGQAFR